MAEKKNYLLDPTPEKGYTHTDIFPFRYKGEGPRAKGTPIELAPPNMLLQSIRGIKQLVGGPYNALTGQLTYDQMKAMAPELAMTMLGLGLGGSSAVRMPPGEYMGSFKGFHGTPHNFDEFSDHAIGSGEGAQVYGHGHYVAGAREVAEQYKRNLSQPEIHFGGKALSKDDPVENWIQGALGNAGLGQLNRTNEAAYALALDDLGDNLKTIKQLRASRPQDYEMQELWARDEQNLLEAYERLGRAKPIDFERKDGGKLLHLEITPEEHELLDWDLPLSKQHPDVIKKLQALPESFQQSLYDHAENHGMNSPLEELGAFTGGDFVKAASHYNVVDDPSDVSYLLAKAGIPGIKYLDQFSRGKTGIADDIRVTRLPEGKFELRMYNSKSGQKLTTDEIHDMLTEEKLGQILGPQITSDVLKQIAAGSGPAPRAWHGGPLDVKGTSNYVIFDPKHIKILNKE